jgi:uncharacterized membrane protein
MKVKIEELENRIKIMEEEISFIKKEVSLLKEKEPSTSLSPNVVSHHLKTKLPKWESLLGGNIIGKFGFLAVILGIFYFIKLSIENEWIGESMRIYIGLLTGFFIMAISQFFKAPELKISRESIIGSGVSIVYGSIYFAYMYYDLLSSFETFFYLLSISLLFIFLSNIFNSQLIYSISLLGCLLSLNSLSTGIYNFAFLFLYFTILHFVFLWINRDKNWSYAPFILLLSDILLILSYRRHPYSDHLISLPILFLSTVQLVFFYNDTKISKSENNLLRFILLFSTTIFTSASMYEILSLNANSFEAFPFLVISILFFLQLNNDKKYLQNKELAFQTIFYLLIAVSFLLVAINLFIENSYVYITNILISAILGIYAGKINHPRLIIFSLVLWIYTLFQFFVYYISKTSEFIFLNPQFIFMIISSVSLYYTAILLNESHKKSKISFKFLSFLTLLISSLFEVKFFFSDQIYRNLNYSYVLGFYASLLLVIGLKYSILDLRRAGFFLVFLLIVKLYLYDIWVLSMIVRIIAMISLGLGLIVAGIMYQKFSKKIEENI